MENLFQYIFDDNKMEGVFAVALVDEPAIDINWVALSKDTIEVKMASEEKRLVVSPLMIPDQKIWRNELNGFVYATKETIERLQMNFAKQRYGNGSNLQHDKLQPVSGAFVCESWIVTDPNNDKANSLGFKNLPEGTWMVSMKIEDDVVWEDYIKTGKVKGVSLEAFLGVQKVNHNTNNNHTNMENNSKIKEIMDNAIKAIQDMKATLPAEVALAVEAPVVPAVQAEEVPADNPEVTDWEAKAAEYEAKIADYEAKMAEHAAKIAELEAKNAELEAKLSAGEEAIVEMAKQKPASAGIVDVPVENAAPAKGLLGALRKVKAQNVN